MTLFNPKCFDVAFLLKRTEILEIRRRISLSDEGKGLSFFLWVSCSCILNKSESSSCNNAATIYFSAFPPTFPRLGTLLSRLSTFPLTFPRLGTSGIRISPPTFPWLGTSESCFVLFPPTEIRLGTPISSASLELNFRFAVVLELHRSTSPPSRRLHSWRTLQGVVVVVVVVVVTFRPNWARTVKIILKVTYQVCEHQKREFSWKLENRQILSILRR